MSASLPNQPSCCRQGGSFGFCEPFWVAVAARKRLTSREVDVGRRLVARRTEYQISRALGIAESTVHSHVLHLETKLEADGHGGAVEKFQLIHNEWRNAPEPDQPPPPGCPWGIH